MDIYCTVYPGLWIYSGQYIQDYGYMLAWDIQDYGYILHNLFRIMDRCWTVYSGLWIDAEQLIQDYKYKLNSLSRIVDIY